MKLTQIKGIAHDLKHHLYDQISFGYFKDLSFPSNLDVLKDEDGLSNMCLAFFKERIPTSFDFDRINAINLEIIKKGLINHEVKIKLIIDNKEFEV